MKTFPIYKLNGSLRGFEITSSWILYWPLVKTLSSVAGVTDIKRKWIGLGDERLTFLYYGAKGVVTEPYGDNSRYWVGLDDPDENAHLDIAPIHEAFKRYRGFTIFYCPVKQIENGT